MVSAGGIILASDMNRALNGGPLRPMTILRKATVSAVATGATAPLLWDIEDLDTDGWHSTSSNTSRITPTKAGWIECVTFINFASNSAGRRAAGFRLNGGAAMYGLVLATSSAGAVAAMASREIQVNGSTDYIEAFGYQDGVASLNTADVANTFFSARWLRE